MSYSKVWLAVAGTVVGMTAGLHAAYPHGRMQKRVVPTPAEGMTLIGTPAPVWPNEAIATAVRPVVERFVNCSDGWITAPVSTPFWQHNGITGRPNVPVTGPFVTSTGQAATLAKQDLATAYEKEVNEVTDVRDRLTVVESEVPLSSGSF